MKRSNSTFYILIFFALAAGSVMVAIFNKVFPLFVSKGIFLCQKIISNIMFEIPNSLPGAFVLAISAVLGLGLLSFLLQLGRTHLLVRKLFANKVNTPKKLVKEMAALGLTDKVILIKDKNLFAFCYGIFSPRILLSTNLLNSLNNKELGAVLLHEQSHLVNRDTFKVLIGKTFSSMFFFLPIFRELHKNTEAVNELLADQWAIGYQEKSTFLRGALKKILLSPQFNFATASNISGPDYFEIRIHRLVNPGLKYKSSISLKSLLTSIIFIFLSWFLLVTPVNAFHMDTQTNPDYFLCSEDQSCPNQCHLYLKKPAPYIPASVSIYRQPQIYTIPH